MDIKKLLKQNEFLEQTIEELEQELQSMLDRKKVKEKDARRLWKRVNVGDVINQDRKETDGST